MKENPQIELSRANLERLYSILRDDVGMDSLDKLFFETSIERAFHVKLPPDNVDSSSA